MNTVTPFYKFRAEAGDEPTAAELLIFDIIGDWADLGEVSAKMFARDLSALPKSVKRLDIHINSPGGSVSEANAIYSRLADHRSDKNVYIDGIAASAATLIAMVGHRIFVRSNATMMVHLPMSIQLGNADDMRTMAAALDSVTESMLNLYTRRTGGDRDAIRALMAAETWMSAQTAVEKGFADEVRGVVKAAAIVGEKKVMFNGVTFDLSRFHNVPAFNATAETTTTGANMETPTTTTQPPATTAAAETTPPATTTPPAATTTPPVAATTTAPATEQKDFDKGIAAERARVAALQKYDKPATHAIIVKAITDGKTVADITEELFTALEKPAQQTARRTDAQALNGITASDTTPSGETEEEKASKDFGDRLTKAVTNVLGRRGFKRQSAAASRN